MIIRSAIIKYFAAKHITNKLHKKMAVKSRKYGQEPWSRATNAEEESALKIDDDLYLTPATCTYSVYCVYERIVVLFVVNVCMM